MRKAAPKHRTRRRGLPQNPSSANASSVPLSGSFDEDDGFREDEGFSFNIDESTLDTRSIEPRKDLIDEADEKALIVKNYRLAKELSDLKTKHREEAKAVTRLTMENMNLAAHMREAMGQIAALKRELLIRQKKIDHLMVQQQMLQGQVDTSSVPDSTTKGTSAQSTPQSNVKGNERTEQDTLKSRSPPDTLTPALQIKDKVGEVKSHNNNKPADDALDACKTIIFSTPPSPSTYNDGSKQAIIPPSPTEAFHENGNAYVPTAFEPFKSPSPLNTEKELPHFVFSSRPNHDFDSFVASFDTHFPNTFWKPKEKSPSRVVAFDEQIFPDPFFPAAASFDGIKSPGSSLHKFDRSPGTNYSTENMATEIFTESDPMSKAALGNKMRLVPPPPRSTQHPEVSPNKKSDVMVSGMVTESNSKSQALPGNKLHQVPPPPRSKQPHEPSPQILDLIVPEISTECNPKTQSLGNKSYSVSPPPLGTVPPESSPSKISLSEPAFSIHDTEKEESDSRLKMDSMLLSSRTRGKKKSTFSETFDLTQSTDKASTPVFSSEKRNEHDPIMHHFDTKAKETARGGVKTKFRPTDSLLNDDGRHENLPKFGNENFHNISKESDGNEKGSKGKVRVSTSNAKENQPIQAQFKDKSLKSGRHSIGSDGASLFSTAFPAMVLPTTNSEKIAAAMDLEIRRLDSLLNTSSYSTRRASSSTHRPISYAEPSTKTKLRRGDKFFPSSDLMTTKD